MFGFSSVLWGENRRAQKPCQSKSDRKRVKAVLAEIELSSGAQIPVFLGSAEFFDHTGWNGFTTRKLAPCRLMANLVALFYNWWNLYVRFYDEEHHREAITSRPALMQGVARQVQSGGQRKVKVSLLHEKGDVIARAVTLISSQLHEMMRIAEQWTIAQRWAMLLTRLLRRWLGGKWIVGVPIEAEPLLSG